MKQEDLEFLESLVEQQSSRLGCPVDCHLSFMDKKNSSIEQRKKIRIELVKEINKKWPDKLSKEQHHSLLIPGKLPQLPFVSISISHSADVGGFIFSGATHCIGLDLERQGRAQEKTVLRISSQEELNLSPSPSALWSAKESAYKAVHFLKDDIYIKKISIFEWEALSLEEYKPPTIDKELEIYDYQFQIENRNDTGKGCVCFVKDTVIGFAFLA